MERRDRRSALPALALGLALACVGAASAQVIRAARQTVYVPLYSEVPYGDRGARHLVRASVVVRNLEVEHPITILSATYHDGDGRRVRELVEAPVKLAPLASRSFDIGETDSSGGVAPSMVIRWRAETAVLPPLVEGLMVSTFQGLGISFRTEGRVLAPPPGR